MGTMRRELCDWASGDRGVERFEAPVDLPGWSARPWVAVRALTEAEALERESLGLIEEYEVVARGLGEPELRVRRVYDLVAMAEYEWAKCLVDWCLPEALTDGRSPLTPGPSPGDRRSHGRGEHGDGGDGDGSGGGEGEPGTEVPGWERASLRDAGEWARRLVTRRMMADDPEANLVFLRGMGPCLGAWVREVLERVNRRLPEQRAEAEIAKKN